VMSTHVKNQQELAEGRAKKLKQIEQDFSDGTISTQCTEASRNDPQVPRCYCYTTTNKVNPAHANSAACGGNSGLYSSKSLNSPSYSPKVCVDINFKVDPLCNCNKARSSNGQNGCLKASAGLDVRGLNPGVFRMLNTGAGPANDLFSGRASGADISVGGQTNAARIMQAAHSLMSKSGPNSLVEAKKHSDKLEGSLLASTSRMSYPGSSSAPAALPTNPKGAAAALESELDEDESPEAAVSRTSQSGTVANDTPEFGLTEEQLAAQESEIAEVMQQDIDMGENDIHSAPKTNIFEILSNRYKRRIPKISEEESKESGK
jgi:hypothetical protein